jgi:aspartyl-tRNA(Asn)/glutamyl-tRNA(Gln) amidotransferase subunit B
MKYLGTCDGNMQEGSLRADVNVSVRKEGDKKLGTRCEIKNVNSIKFMQMAIEYEAKRQVDLLESGESIIQETRLFDIKKNETRSMRSKEDAHDYRYFPDPDLLPLNLEKNLVEKIKKNLPELPDQKKERFIKDYSLSSYEANVLVSEKEVANYFEEVIKTADKKLSTNWIIGDLFATLNDKNISITESPIKAKEMASLVNSISSGLISGRAAKEVFEVMKETGEDPVKIIEEKGLKQKSDPKELETIINKILDENKDKVDQYKAGKEKLFGFFVGQTMQVSRGTANPQLVNDILKKKLK